MRGQHGLPRLPRKSPPPLKDPLGVFLLALGFASVFLAPAPLEITSAAMLSAGLVGLHRATGKRAALFLIAGVVALWVLQHFWDLVPGDTYKISNEHKTLYMAPAFLANVVLVALFAAIPIVARPRIGTGLMVLSLASLAMCVLAKGPLLVAEKEDTLALVFGAMERGWLGVTVRLVAIAFFAAAFDTQTARLEKRGLVIAGVIGAPLFAAAYTTLPEHWGNNGAYGLLGSGALALGLVLSAIGFAGVARAGGGAGSWMAMALAIVQLPMLFFGLLLSDKYESVMGAVGATMLFILLAIGVAGVTAPQMGARAARGFAGILALSALFGTLVSFALLMGAVMNVVHAHDPYSPLHRFAIPLVGHAAVAWAACLAYLVAPPASVFGAKVAA